MRLQLTGNATGGWIESWYIAYALQGAVVAGLIPILLPVFVSRFSRGDVGYVMAAFSLGGLLAPLWGELADTYRLHRVLLAGGLLLTGIALATLTFSTSLAAWLCLAFLEGAGSGAAATVANMFIVENHPQAEWDKRISLLQGFYGAGQVAGLVIAAGLSTVGIVRGLLISAFLALAATGIAIWKAPAPGAETRARPVLRHAARHSDWPIGSPQRLYHITIGALQDVKRIVGSEFGVFLMAWISSFGGATVVFSQYPVLMRSAFGISTAASSLAFGGAAALGLLLYAPAGRLADRIAPRFVLQIGLAARVIAIGGMLMALVFHAFGWLALGAFTVIVLAWSLLSVSSTGLVARISPVGEGSGLGLFNATTAVAGVIGAGAGGWIAGRWGYGAALAFATAGATLGLVGVIARAQRWRGSEDMPGAARI